MEQRRSEPEPLEQMPPGQLVGARERVLRKAYALFRQDGFTNVGVDRVVAEANVAKATLYRHFPSKEALGVAVIDRHEEIWTQDWLEHEADRRATDDEPGIVAVFDALEEWYRAPDYEGCLFTNTVLALRDRSSRTRTAAVGAIANVHHLLERLAADAGVRDAATFAHQIQLLMRGSIVAAVEGHYEAVAQARVVARMLLDHERDST